MNENIQIETVIHNFGLFHQLHLYPTNPYAHHTMEKLMNLEKYQKKKSIKNPKSLNLVKKLWLLILLGEKLVYQFVMI